MKSIVAYGPKDLRLEDRTVGEPGPREVVIRVATGGICGSDLHYYHHGGFGDVRLREPMILGHEISGVVVRPGEDVTGIAVGDLVSVSPSRPCGGCEFCQSGRHNHCVDMRFYGSAMPFPHIQGAFRERLVVHDTQCVKADGLSAGEAAMAEPLSVALHAVRRAGELLGKRVLITGCGPIGAMCILAARLAGAAEVVVCDLVDSALNCAAAIGADRVINVASEPEALTKYQTGKGYFQALFECSGAEVALPRAVIVQLGLGGDMALPVQAMTAKELELRGSFRFHEEFELAVTVMRQGLVDVKPVISHSFGFEEAQQAFAVASDRHKAMKTQIIFSRVETSGGAEY